MKWTREEYPEGYCWKVDIPPLGDFCIDRAEWVDAERPWLACWYVGAYETEIGRARTDTTQQWRWWTHGWRCWRRRSATRGRQGFEPMDDGAHARRPLHEGRTNERDVCASWSATGDGSFSRNLNGTTGARGLGHDRLGRTLSAVKNRRSGVQTGVVARRASGRRRGCCRAGRRIATTWAFPKTRWQTGLGHGFKSTGLD